jgi:hypothetical protein
MALYYDLLVFKEAYKLILVLFGVTKDFPKRYKYSLGHGIKRDGINLVRSVYRANKAKNKIEYLEAFLDDFELIKLEISVCVANYWISPENDTNNAYNFNNFNKSNVRAVRAF